MELPVRDELLREDSPLGAVMGDYLDALLAFRDRIPEDALLVMAIRWVVRQSIARFDGNVEPLVAAVQRALNEPQNERLVHQYLERAGLEVAVPQGSVN